MSVRNQVNRPIVVQAMGRIVAWAAAGKGRRLPGIINSFAKDGSKTTVFFRASNMVDEMGFPCPDDAVPVLQQNVMFTARTSPHSTQVVAHQVRTLSGGPVQLRQFEAEEIDFEEEQPATVAA